MNHHPEDRDGYPDHTPADGTQINELTRTPDHKTGYQMPDPKDHHEAHYTTTPPEDRTASADEGKYHAPQVPDPREVTGQFDHLATRDPAQMDQTLQQPEFAGAQTVGHLTGHASPELAAPIVPELGLNTSRAQVEHLTREARDPNPGYIPPSGKSVPHVSDQPGDLPPGAPSELKAEVDGSGDTRRGR